MSAGHVIHGGSHEVACFFFHGKHDLDADLTLPVLTVVFIAHHCNTLQRRF